MVEAKRVSVTAVALMGMSTGWQVHPTKHNACVGLRRAQGQLHTLSAVQADPHRFGERLKGSLFEHGLILSIPLSFCRTRGCMISITVIEIF